MITISKSKKKDLHRRPSSQKQKIINRFQRFDAISEEKSLTLKQLELSEKKFQNFIENMVSEGTIKVKASEGIERYWLKVSMDKPKNNTFLIVILASAITFLLVIVILPQFFQ